MICLINAIIAVFSALLVIPIVLIVLIASPLYGPLKRLTGPKIGAFRIYKADIFGGKHAFKEYIVNYPDSGNRIDVLLFLMFHSARME